MAVFTYKAIDKGGKTIEGDLDASSRDEVASYIATKGMFLVSAMEKKGQSGTLKKVISLGKGKITFLDRQILFEDLATMLKAGVSLAEALRILREDAEKEVIRELIIDLQFTIEKGSPLSLAMEHYPNLFSPVVINLIKAGEISGNLEKTMGLIAVQFRKDLILRKKISGAMIYPIILFSLSVLVVIILLVFVVPRLATFFKQANMELPTMTKLVIFAGDLVRGSPLFDGIIILGIVALIVFVRKSPKTRLAVLEILAHLPLLKKLFHQIYLYRYCWITGILISSGVDILKSLEIAENVIVSKSYKAALRIIRDQVAKGIPLGEALKQHPNLFPHLVCGLTTVGEKTGSLEFIYRNLSQFYERNFSSALQSLVKVLEPLMLVFMGVVVGGIAMAIVLPIYQFVSGGVR